jgi:hypothetical protein
MKIKYTIYMFLGFLMLTFPSCGLDDETMDNATIDVAAEFQRFVDLFIEEGAKRGFEVDFSDTGLSIQYGTLPEDAAGVCSELGDGNSGSHQIRIRKLYWESLTEIQKERLIFHELGHCELNRPHDNQVFSNGDWKSIMRGAPLPADKTPIVNYTGTRRDYYIDELFQPDTGVPSWLNFSVPYNSVDSSRKSLIYEVSNVSQFQEITTLTGNENFEIEIELEVFSGLQFAGIQWAGPDINNSLHFYLYNGKEIHIASGQQLFGIMHVFDYPSNIAYKKNKFTVRRDDDLYLLYYNEQFLYWIDYFKLTSAVIGSIVHPDMDVMYHTARIYTID